MPSDTATIPEFLTTKELAALWNTPVKAIYEQMRRGQCPLTPFRLHVGKREWLRWSRDEALGALKRED